MIHPLKRTVTSVKTRKLGNTWADLRTQLEDLDFHGHLSAETFHVISLSFTLSEHLMVFMLC